MNNLKFIFEPKSVAVIGASKTKGTVGYGILLNILESNFQGAVFPVNPKYSDIMSTRAYNDVLAIPESVDLAVVCIPSGGVVNVVKQCAEKGIKGIVVISAGFKEIGPTGKKLEDEIISIASKNNIAVLGPNVLGIINTQKNVRLNANFALKLPKAGNVALISQSGAIGVAALDYAHQHDLGISKFISIGNKAVIDESDVLEYLIDDDETKIITIYAEDIANPEHFVKMAKRANAKTKPIIIIKTGRSVRGAIATHSHTGALTTSDTAYDALFAQCGVIRVDTLSELFEFAEGFTCFRQPKGNKVAIVTNGGGLGVIATDAAERYNLEMATFETDTTKALQSKLPSTASVKNPIDIIGDADAKRVSDTLAIIANDKNVDAIVVSILPTVETDMDAIASNLCDFARAHPDLPIFGNLMSLETEPKFEKLLDNANVPNFDFPEIDIRTLAAMIKYYQWIKNPEPKIVKFDVNKKKAQDVINAIRKEGRRHLSETESYMLLEAYGMKIIQHKEVNDLEECLMAAKKIGFPVVLKIISPDILHKIDVGGIKIDIKDEMELKIAFNEISDNVKRKRPDALLQGFLVEKFFTANGLEVIVGANQKKGFGSLIMFGLGGTFVELFKDVAFRLAPLSLQDATNMIMETKGYQILKGFRGQASYDIDAIVDYLLRISQLVSDFPEIMELDLNPIKVLEGHQGILIFDAKIILTEVQNDTLIKPKGIDKKEANFII